MKAAVAPTPELQYAPRPPRGRRIIRRLSVLAVVAAVAGSSAWWFPRLRENAQMFYWQRQCMAHAVPPATVVHDRPDGPPNTAPRVMLVPPQWTSLYGSISPPGLRSEGTVFLHAMKSREGIRRLVAVDEVDGGPLTSNRHVQYVEFCWRVIEPGSVLTRPRVVRTGNHALRFEGDPSGYRLTAGRVDPADPSHFTFTCAVVGRTYTVDGWLRNDDSVSIAPRPDPVDLIPPAPASPASLPTSGGSGPGPSAPPAAR